RAPYYASKIATNLDYNFRLQGSLSARLSSCQARSTNLVAQLKNSMIPLLMGIACARASCRQPSLAFSIDFYL
ncbi:Os09g0129400, partial [Oryza sativa Japonica Group]